MILADAIQSQSLLNWILPLITGIGGVVLGQMLTERRETKSLRTEKRLELYAGIIDFVAAWEDFIAKWDGKATLLPMELQRDRIRLAHRLKLLGSEDAISAFDKLFEDMSHHIDRSETRTVSQVDRSKLALVDQLRKDLGIHRTIWNQCGWFPK